jgi:hypothetical protein
MNVAWLFGVTGFGLEFYVREKGNVFLGDYFISCVEPCMQEFIIIIQLVLENSLSLLL